MSINGDALKYVAMGPGWSGDTDDISVAEAWLRTNNGNGAIYIRRDIAMLEPHDAARLRTNILSAVSDALVSHATTNKDYLPVVEVTDAVIRAIGGER